MLNKFLTMVLSAFLGAIADELKKIKKENDDLRARNKALTQELADNKARADKYEKIVKDQNAGRDDRRRAEDELMG